MKTNRILKKDIKHEHNARRTHRQQMGRIEQHAERGQQNASTEHRFSTTDLQSDKALSAQLRFILC